MTVSNTAAPDLNSSEPGRGHLGSGTGSSEPPVTKFARLKGPPEWLRVMHLKELAQQFSWQRNNLPATISKRRKAVVDLSHEPGGQITIYRPIDLGKG